MSSTIITHAKVPSCPSCDNDKIVEDIHEGIIVCTSCGQILMNDLLCHRADITPFFSTATSYKTNALQCVRSNSSLYNDRSMNKTFNLIHSICVSEKISKRTEDDAINMYKQVCEYNVAKQKKSSDSVSRGMNRHHIAAASIYFACKRNGNSRSPKEIANIFDIDIPKMSKYCKKFKDILIKKKFEIDINTADIEQFVQRYCTTLNIVKLYAKEAIALSLDENILKLSSEHTPPSMAAAIISHVIKQNNLKISQSQLSDMTHISKFTITKISGQIKPTQIIDKPTQVINKPTQATDKPINNKNSQIHCDNIPKDVYDRMVKFGIV